MDSIRTRRNIPYYQGADYSPRDHTLDLYLPEKRGFPTVLFVHGGAWSGGEKEVHQSLGVTLAQKGVATAVIDHRMSPAVKHPQHLIDAARAFFWVHTDISSYGGDENSIFLLGHSSGGHIAALLALSPPRSHEFSTFPSIQGVICISGVFDLVSMAETSWGEGMITSAFGMNPDTWYHASPMNHNPQKAPPFLTIIAEHDLSLIKSQGKEFARKVGAECIEIPGTTHFSIIHSITPESRITHKILWFLDECAKE
ncbi:MAG: alpha/beta hydrolase [Theionarchaea archaeon]|nr:alpha/beta hydrolase [Theionarchaea archaeon]MBU7001065.1 alpha/beta hydrolase [Theionarchaea archaeon]MBU7020554.1 alpha/beta hydrolase [Theionarchaea archaeon]MBU7034179.1 alpha/beta hydrolase [Theionarchaea archaeon]MBU7039277.1 alpha/beta hydrolase [Theionarchaea archaeon]